nr:glycosyltransferase family 1 protein [Opitutae bacterium]
SLFFSPYYPVPKHRPCKGIFTIHDLIPLRHPEWFPNQSTHHFFEKNIREGVHHADHIIADSQSTKQDILDFYSPSSEKVSVVHLAPEDHFFQGRKRKFICIKDQTIAPPYILSVCTFEPRKNLIRTLEAYAIFRKKNPSLKLPLVLAGSLGWGFDNIIKAIQKNSYQEDIISTGFVSEEILVDLYASAEVFVYTSLYEGFGLPILEAMASGTPAITADNSSLGEIGKDAVLYTDPYSPNDIADKIEAITTDNILHERLSEQGRRRAQDFSWQRTALETVSIFERCLSN